MTGLTAQDRKDLIEQFNATDDPTTLGKCLHHLIEHATHTYPDNTALICADTNLSYRQLDAVANRVAHVLVERGVRRGDVVVVALDRSVDLVIALLGTLKAGCAYLPIDPAFPRERIKQIISDAKPKLIVINDGASDVFSTWETLCQSIEEARARRNVGASDLKINIQPHDLAYVIYTSGSTGKPKGVEMSHGAVCNAMCSLKKEPGCTEADRWLAISAIAFDMAVPELFLALMCGGTIVIAQTHETRDPAALLSLMKRHAITSMQATPATWQMLLDSGWQGNPRLKNILCGGEVLSRRLVDQLLSCCDSVWNVYGPAETSYTTVARVSGEEKDIFLGNPIANGRLYILDDDLEPLPLGRTGELCVGGATIARGYLNSPDLTRTRFFKNPFHKGVLYRTGDLGRVDDQVKIRGHRIELEDVESAICSHETVSKAVAMKRGERLVAYCVRKTNGDVNSTPALDRILRPWLAERLPDYMIPSFFIDRKALPDPIESIRAGPSKMPTGELERQILAVWSSVLGHEYIGIEDNFFHIGGDSVRIVRAQVQLQQRLGRAIAIAELFEHYTIRTLAAHLTSTARTKVQGHGNSDSAHIRRKSNTNHHNEDIAVVSMAYDFWQLLVDRRDVIGSNADTPGKSYCRQGGFIEDKLIDSYDAPFFNLSPREARRLDPTQHRAGYVSVSSNCASNSGKVKLDDLDGYAVTGSAGATLSGQSLTIDTACSSSLVTTHLACNALRQGECDLAISGGITLILLKGVDGTGWSEGSARDGDFIQAVIRGLTIPSVSAQQRLIRQALNASGGLRADEIDYIEAHGTGTKLGDPIEASALADRKPLLIGSAKSNIGHAQAAAGLAGIMKVALAMKHSTLPQTLHAAEPSQLVDWAGANMTLVQRNQRWSSRTSNDKTLLRRAGVSSFGIGGTNAHVIIEEPPIRKSSLGGKQQRISLHTLPFLVSGQTKAALQQQIDKLYKHVDINVGSDHRSLGDVSYSLATTRNHFKHRLVFAARDREELLGKLASRSATQIETLSSPNVAGSGSKPRLAMLFTGQGSQLPSMGKDLAQTHHVFHEKIHEIAGYFTRLEKPLLNVMWSEPGSREAALLDRTDFAQPALFTLEVALYRLWQSWGLQPDYLLGHSVGELSAAHVAGVLDLPNACRLVEARSRLMNQIPSHGAMASLQATAKETTRIISELDLIGKVDIASYNTPTQTVVSGDSSAVERMAVRLQHLGRKAKPLEVSQAFHSHHMDAILSRFQHEIETISFNAPETAIVSSLTGQIVEDGELQRPEYWVEQARKAVRFSDSIQTLSRQSIHTLMVELVSRIPGYRHLFLAKTQSLLSRAALASYTCKMCRLTGLPTLAHSVTNARSYRPMPSKGSASSMDSAPRSTRTSVSQTSPVAD
ncbi:polyketide synthase [Xylariaceae sp. FL0016]|nr:polyketide synthase [Xylariaceae sp. FL0016]